MPFQNASSRLTLVLWPATTIERLTTGDFMKRLRRRCGAGQETIGAVAAKLVERAFGLGAAKPRAVGLGLFGRLALVHRRFLKRFKLTTSPISPPLILSPDGEAVK